MTNPQLEAYVLGELPKAERIEVERYLASNPEAALEVERLRIVTTALQRLPEEEPPRRIAFVSDKVFEPNWYQRLWNSGPRLAFASAALLAMAIVAHGVMVAPKPAVTVAAVDQADIRRQVEAEVSRRVDSAMTKAVAEIRAESDAKSRKLVAAALDDAEKKFVFERASDRAAVESKIDIMRKQMNRILYLASNQSSSERQQ
jgi:anti-sigma factor RsiW